MKNQALRSVCIAALLVLSSFLVTPARAQVQTARYVSMTSNTHAFYEYLPQGYSSTGSQTYPLMIFIHGIGELGQGTTSSLPTVLRNGPPRLINIGTFPTSFTVNGQTHKFIVISPQFVAWPNYAQINSIITYCIANYKVDASRVYVTGLSMGGGATWDAGSSATTVNRIAALVPVSGAMTGSTARGRIIANNNLPVWALHNLNDPTVSSNNTVGWINYINTAPAPNPNAKKTIFNASGHDAWSQAYNPAYREDGKNVYEWMLSYTTSRGSNPAVNTPPVVNAGPDQTITAPASYVWLAGSATDNGSVRSTSWSLVSGPATSNFSSKTILGPIFNNLAAGTYTLRLTAVDDAGLTSSDDVVITVRASGTVVTPPVATTTKYIRVALYGGADAYSNTQWNNWNLGTGLHYDIQSSTFRYTDGSTSSIAAKLSQSNDIGDNGATYAGGMAPQEVLRHTSWSTVERTLTFTGLRPSTRYDFESYASRLTNANNTTVFKNGTLQKGVPTFKNYTVKAAFGGLMSDASGTLVITISRQNTYNYINGFMLTEGSTVTTASVSRTADQATASTGTTAATEGYVVDGTPVAASPAAIQDRTAITLDNQLTGTFNVAITDMEGNVVKQLSLGKSKAGLSQSYVSLGGLKTGNYIVIATQGEYTEAIIITKL